MRTRRPEHFEAYAAAAAVLIDEQTGYLARWGDRAPGPGLRPVPVDLPDVVIPLVQQHVVAADHREAAGELRRARELRWAARDLATRFLDEGQRAEHHDPGHAELLHAEGRIGEGMALLERAEATLYSRGAFLQAAAVRLTRARLLRHLEDHATALKVLGTFEQDLLAGLPEGVPGAAEIAEAEQAAYDAIRRGAGDRSPVVAAEKLVRRRELLLQLWDLKSWLLTDVGAHEEAEELVRHLMPYLRETEMEAAGLLHLSSLAWRRGDLAAARRWSAGAAPAFECPPGDDGAFAASALRSKLPAYCLMRARLCPEPPAAEQDDALRWLDRGLGAVGEHPDPETEWRLHAEKAKLLVRRSLPSSAQRAYAEAVRVIDGRRRVSAGLRWDNLYLRERLPVMQEALDLAAERSDAFAALAVIDLLKARSFAARLALLPAPGSDAPTDDERELARITAELDAAEYGTALTSGGAVDGSAAPGPQPGIAQWRMRRRRLVEDIRRKDPRWRALTEGLPADPGASIRAAVERVLGPAGDTGTTSRGERAALSLYRRPGRIVAVLVSGDGTEVGIRTLSDRTARALEAFEANVRLGAAADRGLFDFSTAFGVTFEDLVPGRMAERALRARTLLVVPHADLHGLPWQLLMACGQRLVRHTAVGVLPNLAAMATLDRPAAGSVRASLFGAPRYPDSAGLAPLREAEGELRDIEALYADGRLLSRIACGARARVPHLLDLLARQGGSGTILHVACHGAAEHDDPYEAGLMLADGRLGVAELSLRRIRFDEVVLSTCRGALRPSRSSPGKSAVELVADDALTMVHVLHEAGAAFVLGSPLPIGDKAARAFTTAWHRHRRTEQPLQACRAAACELLDDADRTSHHSWGGMTGYGCR